jgi:hypothetical protein
MSNDKKRVQKTIDLRFEQLPTLEENARKAGYVTKTGKPKLGAFLVDRGMTEDGLMRRVRGVGQLLNCFEDVRVFSINMRKYRDTASTIESQLIDIKNNPELFKSVIINQLIDSVDYLNNSNKNIERTLNEIVDGFKGVNNKIEEIMES